MKLPLLSIFIIMSQFVYSSDWFTKNVGQIKNQSGQSNNEVLYVLNINELTITLREKGFSYEVKNVNSQIDDIENATKDFSFSALIERIDFEFPNQPKEIITESKSLAKMNFYSDLGSFEEIPQYKKIIYTDVAEDIDVEFLIENGQFKYNVIAKPSAKLSQFFIKINSARAPRLLADELVLETTEGEIKETIPVSYIKESNKKITVKYILEDRKLYFESSENIDKKTLIVDPVPDLIWNTYFGGSQYDIVTDIKITDDNQVYQTGITMSLDNISTSGSYQVNYQGDLDAFVSKLDIDGNLIWSTYYAGPQSERVYSIDIDSLGNSFVGGTTFSESGIATPGAHQQYIDGADDMFIFKLSSNGQRDWCTYHGGNGHDFITDMVVYNDTIYATGHTTSTNNIASNHAHLETNSTSEAGHITLFSVYGSFLWGTFFGEENNNSIEGIAVNDHSIFVTGRTNATMGISTTGVHQESLTGFMDGFIAKFNKTGNQIWGTYFGGDYSDKSNSITLDEDENVYICGDASSENQIATNGAYQVTRLSSEQGFLSKFSTLGQQIWGSYIGGYNSNYLDVIKYKNGFLYIGGETLSTSEISSTDVFQPSKSDGFDLFIQKFDTLGGFNWGTYFGGTANENISSIEITSNNQIVLAGNTNASSSNFATNDAHQENFGGGSSDGFLTYLCQPVKPEINYYDGELISTSSNDYNWYFEGISLNESSQSISPNEDGNYLVITSNNGRCQDTSEVFTYSSVGGQDEKLDLIKIYPNPTNDYVNVEYEGLSKIELIDPQGKVIISEAVKNQASLNVQYLPNGLYFLKLTNSEHSLFRKIIVKN